MLETLSGWGKGQSSVVYWGKTFVSCMCWQENWGYTRRHYYWMLKAPPMTAWGAAMTTPSPLSVTEHWVGGPSRRLTSLLPSIIESSPAHRTFTIAAVGIATAGALTNRFNDQRTWLKSDKDLVYFSPHTFDITTQPLLTFCLATWLWSAKKAGWKRRSKRACGSFVRSLLYWQGHFPIDGMASRGAWRRWYQRQDQIDRDRGMGYWWRKRRCM